ncbi:MAG: T9SS type A sorting domain-containing protein [candidate division Zixibacteria bacterium]|nr:T9SS type A sorting domain-containing protein [candidate division Zixibacteria bacterium]
MKAKMTIVVIAFFFLLLQNISAQVFTSEWEYNGGLNVMRDMDGDGAYELISGGGDTTTRSIYDAATHALKWTITGMRVDGLFCITEGYLSSSYDLNDDGTNELICKLRDDSSVVVYDVANDSILFRLGDGAKYGDLKYWGDIDNDGIIEIVVGLSYYTGYEWDSSKTIIYSTGVAQSVTEDNGNEIPAAYKLEQNYPNPFNPSTIIEYQVQRAGHVRLTVYNTLGQRVNTLVDEYRSAGDYSIQWDSKDESGGSVASGVYYYQLEIGEFASSKKMVIIK